MTTTTLASRVIFWSGALLALLNIAAAAEPDLTKPLPGQIVIDPDHPRWLMRHGGQHLFICGPGDPEDFLYRGTRNSDGTRDGDQEALIRKLIEHGGNCIYFQAVRSGGDGPRDHNPFIDSIPARGVDMRILDQWERWFTLMDDHGIVIYFFLYDDGVRPWGAKKDVDVPPQEQQFIETLVRRFRHHRNLIWVIAEESEEAVSGERVRALAQIIRRNDHAGRVIGDHHQSSTTFKNWRPESALNHFAMQYTAAGNAAHAGAIEALAKAAGRYQVIYSESTAAEPDAHHAWACTMGGLMPMLLKMDIASTRVETLNQCRALQTFLEATDFVTMSPHDELAAAGTQWVLADPGRSYIAYSENLTGPMGVRGLTPGPCEIRWLDCRTGKTVVEKQMASADEATFGRPPGIGNWCAAWIRQTQESGVWPLRKWPEAAPREVGLDEALLMKARDYALTGGGSGYITHGGKLVMSWGDPRKRYDLKSTTKSFGATALGVAIADGKISLTDKARQHHPTLGTPPEENAATGWLEKITILHLATQTAGFAKPGGYEKLLFEPGTKWHYSDGGPNWLAECVTRVYGRDVDELMFERVFTPLGITRDDLVWRRNSYRPKEIDGIVRREFGSGISANVDAMARLGYLYLRQGNWNGRQILPPEFVKQAGTTVPSVVGLAEVDSQHGNASDHYGLLWWNNADGTLADVPRDAFWSWGLYDSLIVVIPSLDIVVSRAGNSWKRDGGDHYDVLQPFLEPICRSAAIVK